MTKSQAGHVAQPKRFRRCILHIGTVKTGTKTIQDYLQRNPKWTLQQGVLYPRESCRSNASQWEFVAATHSTPWKQDLGHVLGIKDPTSQARFKARFSESLVREFANARNCDTLLISSEHFQSRLRKKADLLALKQFLDPWVETFEIVVYFRRQDKLALSFLSTRLKSSVPLQGDNAMHIINTTPGYYDYLALYRRWQGVFGQDAMIARLFDPSFWPNGDLLCDFAAACRFSQPSEKAGTLNRSLNKKGFHFLLTLNRMFPENPSGVRSADRAHLVREISNLFPGKYYPISRSQARAFYEKFDDGNKELQRIAFKTVEHPIFDTDFNEYPETEDPLEPNYEDAVEIALALWSVKQMKEPIHVQIGEWIRSVRRQMLLKVRGHE